MSLDRRRNKKLITRNTEYHIHQRECVAVRDRRSGQWLHNHPALRTLLLGGMDRKRALFDSVLPGSRLVFSNGRKDILTSPLLEVERPQKVTLERYTWRSTAGVIQVAA